MSPTISAANKASLPKKKILGERNNETLDAVEQHFRSKPVKCDSDDDVEKDFVGLKPYDPVKNYLSPRPKFLRYNPDRRRKILSLQENVEDRVEVSTDFDAGSIGIPELQDSCSGQESVEEARDVSSESEDESGDECGSEDDEEEMVEFVEDRCCSVKGLFKFVFVVIALVLMTQAICSMNNTPSPSHSLDSVLGFNGSLNHVYDLSLSKVVYGPIREPVFLVERLKEGDVYDDGRQDVSATSEEFVEDEAENDDSDEVLREEENKTSEVVETEYVDAETVDDSNQNEKNHQPTNNEILQEDETEATEVVDRDYVEAETVRRDDVTEEDDGKDHQLTNDVEFETTNDMEDGVENELDDDTKTNDVLVKFTSFDLTIAILLGHVLVLTSFGAIYRSRCKKVEKEEFQATEPSTNPQSVMEEQLVTNEFVPPQQNDVSKEVNHVHIPSVELLGEFVFGEETTTSNMSPEVNNQTTAVSSSQTETSHTVKKQRRKNAEVVTPSSVSVRRSSRLKTRSSVMSP
ncbi:hypothetical protein HanOQP8_Chr09g0346111 [Helianthus annuus]|nr:hypothetical protein HanLR1_Chr09g0342021 [Helianthus annuus]KAJ0713459.1 hypothetical protein HanOQP8_Chr09g0346111 [Helianthus annuus]